MSAAGVVTIALVVVAIVVVALFLIRIATVLRQISRSLTTVIGAVAAIPERTEALAPVLGSINSDLGTARGVLEGLLAKKLGPPPDPSRIVYRRQVVPEFEPRLEPVARPEPPRRPEPAPRPDPAPPAPAAERPHYSSDRIVYRRESPPPSAEPMPVPTGPPAPQDAPGPDPPPAVIHYRRRGQ